MLAHFRESLALSSQGIPRRWLIIPYTLLFHLTKRSLKTPDCDLWLRNSLANDYWEFAQSDLDLTVWANGGMKDAAILWPRIKSMRKMLLGGEIHIFPSDLVSKYLAYANPLELGRDPLLAAKISFTRKPTKYEKIAFLVKSLINDKKLASQPGLRRKKWLWILKSVDPDYQFLPLNFSCEYIISKFLKPLAPWLDLFSAEEISFVLRTPQCPIELSGLEKMLKPNQQIWFDLEISEDSLLLERAGSEFQVYLFSMMSWEVWGIFPLVQLTCGLTLLQLSQHIKNQMRLIDQLEISDERKLFLKNGFIQLQNDYDSIRDRF